MPGYYKGYQVYEYETTWDFYVKHYGLHLDPDFVPDKRGGNAVWSSDNLIWIEKPNLVSIEWVGFNPRRWFKFVRTYTEPKAFKFFMDRAMEDRNTTEAGYQTPVNKMAHNNGNCLNALHYGIHTNSEKAASREVTLMSRSSFLVHTGILDLYLGSLVANTLEAAIGKPVHLKWVLSQSQVIMIQALPWLIALSTYEGARLGIPPEKTWVLENIVSNHPVKNPYINTLRKNYYEFTHPWIGADHWNYMAIPRMTDKAAKLAARIKANPDGWTTFFPGMDTIYDTSQAMSQFSPEELGEDEDDGDLSLKETEE